jgi:hypothetical protein
VYGSTNDPLPEATQYLAWSLTRISKTTPCTERTPVALTLP